MTFLKIVLALYLAGALLNVLQMVRAYKRFENVHIPIKDLLYMFFFIFIRPHHLVKGVWLALLDWEWLDNKIAQDEDGHWIKVENERVRMKE